MVNTDKLRGLIAEKNLSQKAVAQELGISKKTMTNKMQNGKFSNDEMDKLIKLLEIKDPVAIFFAQLVT